MDLVDGAGLVVAWVLLLSITVLIWVSHLGGLPFLLLLIRCFPILWYCLHCKMQLILEEGEELLQLSIIPIESLEWHFPTAFDFIDAELQAYCWDHRLLLVFLVLWEWNASLKDLPEGEGLFIDSCGYVLIHFYHLEGLSLAQACEDFENLTSWDCHRDVDLDVWELLLHLESA